MNLKRFAIAVFAIFVFTAVFDFLIHEMLLKETYAATAGLWRSESEFENVMWLMTLTQLLFACGFAFLFTRN